MRVDADLWIVLPASGRETWANMTLTDARSKPRSASISDPRLTANGRLATTLLHGPLYH